MVVDDGDDEEGANSFSSGFGGVVVVGVEAQAPSSRDNISIVPSNIQSL